MEDRPDITIGLIADHAILRMAMKPARFELQKMVSGETLRETVRRILAVTSDRKAVLEWLTGVMEVPINQSTFYRFVKAVDKAAVEVHRDMIGGFAGPVLVDYRVAGLRLCVGPKQVAELVDAGKLAAVDVAGEMRISQSAIQQFIQANAVKRPKRKAKRAPRSAPSAEVRPR